MTDPQISVIIPARDAAPTLDRTLEALRAQETDQGYEVIVVDDGSRDGTPEIAQRHQPLVRLIRSESSAGPGAARNHGVLAARAPVLAFTDADCFPEPHWLARGCQALAAAEIVQGRVVPDPVVPRTPFDRSLSVETDGGFYQTANLFVGREVFEAVGGFRDWALERPGRRRWSADRRRARAVRTPIGEDTLFAWSARRLGFRSAFAGDAVVRHAVVPGGIRDAIADRWHWTRDMPGLVRRVPELRRAIMYRRVFFGYWTAYIDLAAVGVLAALITRRRVWLLAALPYARRMRQDAEPYHFGGRPGVVLSYVLGSTAVDAATLGGLLRGTIAWRSLVL